MYYIDIIQYTQFVYSILCGMKTKVKSKFRSSRRRKHGGKNKSRKKRASHVAKEFERLKCGPVQENYFTCYDNDTLHKLRDGWNARHPDARIETNDPKEIWTAMKQRFGKMCRNEACWMKQLMIGSNSGSSVTEVTEASKRKGKWSDEEVELMMNMLRTYSSLSIKAIRGKLSQIHSIEISDAALGKFRKMI